MKFLHLIPSLSTKAGGTSEAVRQLCIAALAAGDSAEVAVLDASGVEWAATAGVRCHVLGPARLRYAWSPRLVPWLRANGSRFDAIIVHGLWQFHTYAAWRALRGSATPYFVFPHGMLDPWFKRRHPLKHAKKWLYWPWADYRALRDASGVLFTCEEERRLARESFWLYQAKEIVVAFGTRTPPGDGARQRAVFMEAFPELEGRRILLFLGRIHHKKGCDLLVDAFARACRAHLRAHLVFAGPDDEGWANELRAHAAQLGVADRITWTGILEGDAKWGALRAADAFVLPSHSENFGIAVVEALACGVPVLISNRVNIWPEIVDAGAGLVAPDTAAGVQGLLERWLATGAQQRAIMALRATECFSKHFSSDASHRSIVTAVSRTARS